MCLHCPGVASLYVPLYVPALPRGCVPRGVWLASFLVGGGATDSSIEPVLEEEVVRQGATDSSIQACDHFERFEMWPTHHLLQCVCVCVCVYVCMYVCVSVRLSVCV